MSDLFIELFIMDICSWTHRRNIYYPDTSHLNGKWVALRVHLIASRGRGFMIYGKREVEVINEEYNWCECALSDPLPSVSSEL